MMRRKWVCVVMRSGFHNGCECREGEPHVGWDCGFRWEMSLIETPETTVIAQQVNWLLRELAKA